MELGNTSVRLVNPAATSAPESPTSPSYGLKSGSLSPLRDFGSVRRSHRTHRRSRNDHSAGIRLSGPGRSHRFPDFHLGVLLVALNVNQFAQDFVLARFFIHLHHRSYASALGRFGRLGLIDRICRNGRGGERRRHQLCQRDPAGPLRRAGVSLAADRRWLRQSRAIWPIATCKSPRA